MLKKRYIVFVAALLSSAVQSEMAQAQKKNTDSAASSKVEEINLPLNNVVDRRSFTGAVAKISGEDLLRYPDLSLSNTFQGRLMGVYVRSTSSGLGNNTSSLFVRGLSRGGSDNALTLVDGIERPIDFLNPEEVASVEVLKDAASKILYGPRAANGIILITTKRGMEGRNVLNVKAEYGLSSVGRMPEFLDSYQYAQLYNEARANDGLSPFYSQQALEGYRNSSGPDDQLHPNVDYYNYFINQSAPIRRASLNYSGGGDNSKFALVLGYTGANGFEKHGKTPTQDRINLRGNLDFRISDDFKAFVDAAGVIDRRLWAGLNQNEVFGAMSTHRPNEYPIFITDPALTGQLPAIGLSYVPPLGGSFVRPANLMGGLAYGGYTQHNYFYGQTNFGLDLNLNKVVKGFSVKGVLNFDNYQFFQSGRAETAPTYSRQSVIDGNGQETVSYVNLLKRVVANSDVRQSEEITRNYGFTGSLNYNNQFENSLLTGSLSHFYYKRENSSTYQDTENTNTLLNLRYAIANKIFLDGSAALMGSNKFAKGNRYGLFPAIGLGWVLSEENFLNNSTSINFLKLKTSFGILGYDRATAFYLFDDRWGNNGTYTLGEANAGNTVPRTSLNLIGNPDLKWEKSRELNIGVEARMFDNNVSLEFNYFNELRYDMVINPFNIYSTFSGGLYPRLNIGETFNNGVEGQITWQNKIGEVDLRLGGNFIFSKNDVLANESLIFNEQNLNSINQSSDIVFGYLANGLFKNQAEVDAAPKQTLGQYGVGDISYADLNGDNIIDERDRKVIGNNFPRTSIGLDVNLKYRGIGLYVLGTSELGVNNMRDNNYYRNNAESKYSILALDRFHPVNNPDGNMPRLTTYSGSNNNVASTYWIENANFFRLKNVELSYDLAAGGKTVQNYRFFARGTNLFVLSDNKDLDPEVINAGVTNYPLYRTFTLGASVNF
jgi:TonB-linked SusC/RagA family outer membrane protein